jgi:hypothetical protein
MDMGGTGDRIVELMLKLRENMRQLSSLMVINDGHCPHHLSANAFPLLCHQVVAYNIPDGFRTCPVAIAPGEVIERLYQFLRYRNPQTSNLGHGRRNTFWTIIIPTSAPVKARPCHDFITPQNDAGVTYISGWSAGVLRYVALDSFDLVEEIERIPL